MYAGLDYGPGLWIKTKRNRTRFLSDTVQSDAKNPRYNFQLSNHSLPNRNNKNIQTASINNLYGEKYTSSTYFYIYTVRKGEMKM